MPLKDALRNPFFEELKHKPINVDEKKEVTAPIETIKVKLDFENLGGDGVGRISPIKSIRVDNKENSVNNVEKTVSSPTKSVQRAPLADVTNKKPTKKPAKATKLKKPSTKATEVVVEVKSVDIIPKEESDLAERLLSKLVNVLKSSPKKNKPAPSRTSSVKNIFAALGKDDKKDKKDDDKKEDPNPSKKSTKKAKEPKKEKQSRKRKREDDEVVEEVRSSKRLKLKQETVQISLVEEEKPKEAKPSKKKDKGTKAKKEKDTKEAKKTEKSTSTKKRKRDADEEVDERPVKKSKPEDRPSRTRVKLEKFMVGASEKKKSKK